MGAIYTIRKKYNWLVLTIASYVFYASIHLEYAIVMLASTIVAYFTAIMMSKVKKGRVFFFLIGILTDLSLLFFFKYLGFFLENVNFLFGTEIDTGYSIAKNIILPIGISFYTFQSLSYTIDVYRKQREPEKHFGYYALYISFFPQLVAGPIERSQYLIPQLKKKVKPNLDRFIQGGKLILWGLFKKIVIADTIGTYVNHVFISPDGHNSAEITLAVYAFAFQVYFDFSGYSNIAIGSAKMFGIDLSMNFNSPLTSKTLSELWKKWHITLMGFFNTYIFHPLVKSQRIFHKWGAGAILVVFFISGLWHGASWNFVIFGLVNGLAIVIERRTKFAKKIQQRVKKKQLGLAFKLLLIFYSVSVLSFSSIWFKTKLLMKLLILFQKLELSISKVHE
ncbi:MAG: MBOAT family protein [Flavobacteriales bacterium]|nr:MBOAT family protein [Flavobacteriales bacterium]